MNERAHGSRQAPSITPQMRRGLLWATLVVIAAGGAFALRRAGRPATRRYRLERVDRGVIRSEVTAPGTVSSVTMTSRAQVQTRVAEADAGRVRVGDAATVRCPVDADHELNGTVSEIRAAVGTIDGVVQHVVLIDADRGDGALVPGMSAAVSIEVARRDGVLRLPLRALRFAPSAIELRVAVTPNTGLVFVLDHARPRPVRVTIGARDLGHAELVAGALQEGDSVIVGQETEIGSGGDR